MASELDGRVFLLMMAARKLGDYLYAWGGEEADEGGYDCSGYISEVLTQANRAWPGLYDGGRTTAAGLYDYYDGKGCPDITSLSELKPASIVFYRRPGKRIHHVAVHVANVPRVKLGNRNAEVGPIAFESGGGRSSTTSPRSALRKSAGIRLTATDVHGNGVEWLAKDPFVLL